MDEVSSTDRFVLPRLRQPAPESDPFTIAIGTVRELEAAIAAGTLERAVTAEKKRKAIVNKLAGKQPGAKRTPTQPRSTPTGNNRKSTPSSTPSTRQPRQAARKSNTDEVMNPSELQDYLASLGQTAIVDTTFQAPPVRIASSSEPTPTSAETMAVTTEPNSANQDSDKSVAVEAEGPSKPQRKQTRCKFYADGACFKKDCLFSHDFVPDKKQEVCKFFLGRRCAKGDGCFYSHDLKQLPCDRHMAATCRRGDQCPFSHDAALIEQHIKQRAPPPTPPSILTLLPTITMFDPEIALQASEHDDM
jgi:hypothetical protein